MLTLAFSTREGVKDTTSKVTSKFGTKTTKPLSPKVLGKVICPPAPQRKECQKGHDALEIIHRPFILPK